MQNEHADKLQRHCNDATASATEEAAAFIVRRLPSAVRKRLKPA